MPNDSPHKVKNQTSLVEQLKRGNVTLFLGAGASYGSQNKDGNEIPLGFDLRDMLCEKFLAGNEKHRSLQTVANFVTTDFGLQNLNRYVAEVFADFTPNTGIKLLSGFIWSSIYSINYDLLVEKSYSNNPTPLQNLVSIYKDANSIDKDITRLPNSVPFYKIHGSIDQLHDRQAPLVLTTSSYAQVKSYRIGLFERLIKDVREKTIVFIGTKLEDSHIQNILDDTEKFYGEDRPMHYLVDPSLSEYDVRYFGNRKITCIKLGVDQFMQELDLLIDPKDRILSLAMPTLEHPIQKHFKSQSSIPKDLSEFISEKVEYVHEGIPSSSVTAELFFKGASNSWTPVQKNYDIERDGFESLIIKILLQAESKNLEVDIVTISGVAGSGKTTFMRRLAYDLGITHGELVLYSEHGYPLRANPIVELYENTGKRVFLFVDCAADLISDLERICLDLDKQNIPITIVLADTKAAYGDRLICLDEYIRESRTLNKLSENEISLILKKLKETNCLGELQEFDDEKQRQVFAELADKQLLVALYEATQGKPLEDLIVREYERILQTEAQQLYLFVSTLHRFGIPVRAGLVSRAMKISFVDFEKRFLGPLEGLIFSHMDRKIRDYVYKTRHPHIAEILFRRILDTQSKQIDQYRDILENLNPTYSSDDRALKQMISSYSLGELTTNLNERRLLIDVARATIPNNPFIIQQRALIEMNSQNGNLEVAEKLLQEAKELSPNDPSLIHSEATLYSRKADLAKDSLRAKTLRSKSMSLLKSIRQRGRDGSYIQMSMGKLYVKEIEDLMNDKASLEKPTSQRNLLRLLQDAYKEFDAAEQSSIHGDSVIREKAKLSEILNKSHEGISILQNALKERPDSKRLALSYNSAIRKTNSIDGRSALTQALVSHPNDKRLNEALYLSLLGEGDPYRDELMTPLRKSFTAENDNVLMHAHALRYHFVRGDDEEYEKLLSSSKVLAKRRKVSKKMILDIQPSKFGLSEWVGTVMRVDPYFTFLEVPALRENVYCSSRFVDADVWEELTSGKSVKFELGFNLVGPIAINLNT